jgi:uncharacterized protein (DUF58 family)
VDELLHRVRTRLAIRAHRKVRGLLDGEYVSLFHGKSLDFDDLRAYVPGDDVKDIDWKATARVGSPLTKRYIATRKHAVLLIVDTGRDFAALSEAGTPKRDLAVLAAGVIGYLAVRHVRNMFPSAAPSRTSNACSGSSTRARASARVPAGWPPSSATSGARSGAECSSS